MYFKPRSILFVLHFPSIPYVRNPLYSKLKQEEIYDKVVYVRLVKICWLFIGMWLLK